jgi:S-adenosylmethionine:diacylglycerol 3-amino-3-carboxypropyl transferase
MVSTAHQNVTRAVHRHRHLSKQGLLERAFTFAFRGLVYAQIWGDPEVNINTAHIALSRLKLAAAQALPDHEASLLRQGGLPGECGCKLSSPRKLGPGKASLWSIHLRSQLVLG